MNADKKREQDILAQVIRIGDQTEEILTPKRQCPKKEKSEIFNFEEFQRKINKLKEDNTIELLKAKNVGEQKIELKTSLFFKEEKERERLKQEIQAEKLMIEHLKHLKKEYEAEN